jgi:elongation factor Tu
MNRPADAEVMFHLLATELGGKDRPIMSGYRPAYAIKEDYWTSTNHEFLDAPELEPGTAGRAQVWFLSPEVYPKSLWIGREIPVAEGSRVVGKAIVVAIFNPLSLA